jgi:hypothetical protein
MTAPREQMDLDRCALLRLGLAGASALVLSTSGRVLAGETTGVKRKVLKEVDSNSRLRQDPRARHDLSAGRLDAHQYHGK